MKIFFEILLKLKSNMFVKKLNFKRYSSNLYTGLVGTPISWSRNSISFYTLFKNHSCITCLQNLTPPGPLIIPENISPGRGTGEQQQILAPLTTLHTTQAKIRNRATTSKTTTVVSTIIENCSTALSFNPSKSTPRLSKTNRTKPFRPSSDSPGGPCRISKRKTIIFTFRTNPILIPRYLNHTFAAHYPIFMYSTLSISFILI